MHMVTNMARVRIRKQQARVLYTVEQLFYSDKALIVLLAWSNISHVLEIKEHMMTVSVFNISQIAKTLNTVL